MLSFLGRGRGGRSKEARNSGMENISSGQAPRTADPKRAALVCCYFAGAGAFCVERRDGRWKKRLIHAPDGSLWWKQKDFRKTRPMVWAFMVFWEVQSSGILEAVPLEICVFEEFSAEQRSPPCRGDSASVCRLGHTRISAESSKHCLTQGMCWGGVCSRPTFIHPLFRGSSRSCDPVNLPGSWAGCSVFLSVVLTLLPVLIQFLHHDANSNYKSNHTTCLLKLLSHSEFSFILVIWCLLPYFIYCI